jgi:uncharacterized protein (DUF1697 family)
VQFAAFFRNTNLGRPGSPSKHELEAAFADAGAVGPHSFQSNGTLIFEATSTRNARSVLALAATTLRVTSGLVEPGCVRSFASLAELPFAEVFGGIDRAAVYELTVSFACDQLAATPSVPFANPRRDAEVLWLHDGNALSITRKIMSGPGSPNRLLEQVTGARFTSRSILTMKRLLARRVNMFVIRAR